MSNQDFVHLHVHTAYSLLDASCRIKSLVQRVKELGMTACAITDHGNLFGAVAFYEECAAQGIKPIIGCEIYVREYREDEVYPSDKEEHLVLLCQNLIGYHNLIRLVSRGYKNQTGIHPVVTMQEVKQYSAGLIALSGCKNGHIARCLLRGDRQTATKDAAEFSYIFSGGRFYLEIFDHLEPEDATLKREMIRLSAQTGIPLAAANDVHFLTPADVKDHQILCGIADPDVKPEQMHSNEYYLKSGEEMQRLMVDCPAAVYNTARIAGNCNLRLDFGSRLLPEFCKEGVNDNAAYLRCRAAKGLNRRYATSSDEAKERLVYELSVIEEMGFVDYFLIVADFIGYAKKNDIPVGPGRGSGVGSLVAYCIGITEIDPLKYGLLFERFLNPERVSMPDFDIDFCYERRDEVIDYIIGKYGKDRVAQIVTFGTLAARASVRDVGRALHMDPKLYGEVAKLIPGGPKVTLDGALQEIKPLRELYENDSQVKWLIDSCKRVEGLPRHTATHAAGIVITPKAVDEYVPLAKNDDVTVTQYNMTELEKLGLLKIDFLGSRNLTALRDCEREIQKLFPEFSLRKISLEEASIYSMLSRGETDGVFQLESEGMRRVLTRLQPQSFEDIIAVIALYRPGPMDAIPDYIKHRHDPQSAVYLHPALKPILSETYGCIVYQEQVMRICRELAGYSYGRADVVRRAMAKKKADVMEKEHEAFLSGCEENGIDKDTAAKIFDQMAAFASYAFNKSHAAAYALITYQTAYCRRFYPAQFYAALMNAFGESTGKLSGYTSICRRMGISLLLPDVNFANADFTAEDGAIRFGMRAIKGIGRTLAQRIESERMQNGAFASFEDFCRRMAKKECSKQAVQSLILAGGFDSFTAHNRDEMLAVCDELMQQHGGGRSEIAGQLSLFGEQLQNESVAWRSLPMPDPQKMAEYEKRAIGFCISGHPLDAIDHGKLPSDLTGIGELHGMSESGIGKKYLMLGFLSSLKVTRTKKGDKMAFAVLDDGYDRIEVIAFSTVFSHFEPMIREELPLFVSGTLRKNDRGQLQFIADSFVLLQRAEEFWGQNYGKENREPQKNVSVYIKVRSKKDVRLKIAAKLFAKHPGNDEVYLYFEDTAQYFLWKQYRISFDKILSNQLKSVFGNQEVVGKIRKKPQTS